MSWHVENIRAKNDLFVALLLSGAKLQVKWRSSTPMSMHTNSTNALCCGSIHQSRLAGLTGGSTLLS
jgi:hypothetical protein